MTILSVGFILEFKSLTCSNLDLHCDLSNSGKSCQAALFLARCLSRCFFSLSLDVSKLTFFAAVHDLAGG